MIKSFTITNHLGESIELEMTRPDKTGFIIKSVDGLDPVKAKMNTTKVAMNDGVKYNSSYLDQRSIVMNLEYMMTPTETIEDIRHKAYKYFPINKKIDITIETDKRTVKTSGYVENHDVTIFSKNEGSAITILCDDPFLYSIEGNETVFSGINALFEFPFSNDSLTDPLLEMGSIENKTDAIVVYEGDYEIGFTIIIHAIGEVTNLSIHNLTTKEQMNIDTTKLATLTGSGIIAGDTITIETKKKNKSITLLRDGKLINILNCLDRGTKWFQLVKGDNIFTYRAESGSTELQFRIINNVIYEGL